MHVHIFTCIYIHIHMHTYIHTFWTLLVHTKHRVQHIHLISDKKCKEISKIFEHVCRVNHQSHAWNTYATSHSHALNICTTNTGRIPAKTHLRRRLEASQSAGCVYVYIYIYIYMYIYTYTYTYIHMNIHTFLSWMRVSTYIHRGVCIHLTAGCVYVHKHEIPTIIDPSATINYPSATGWIIVGISVHRRMHAFISWVRVCT